MLMFSYVICLGVFDTAGHYEPDFGIVDGGGGAVRAGVGGVAGAVRAGVGGVAGAVRAGVGGGAGEFLMAGMCV